MDRFITRADQLYSQDQIRIQTQSAKMMDSCLSQEEALQRSMLSDRALGAAALAQAEIEAQSRHSLEAAMESALSLAGARSAAEAWAQGGIGAQSRHSLEAAIESAVGMAGARSMAEALAQAGIGAQSRHSLEAAMESALSLAGARSAAEAWAQGGIGAQSRHSLEAAIESAVGMAGARSVAEALAQGGIGAQSRHSLEATIESAVGMAGARSVAEALAQGGIGAQDRHSLEAAIESALSLAGARSYRSHVPANNSLLEIHSQFRHIGYVPEGFVKNLVATEDVAQLISRATSEVQSIAERTEFFLSAIETQSNPQSKFVIWLVAGYILNKLVDAIFSHIAELIVTAAIATNPSNALQSKQVKHTVSQVLGTSEILQDYRYVKADVLKVRRNPRAQSPVIANFELGQAVLLVEKDKNGFSLVEWKDSESGVEIRGWVFTRYLAKFH